MGSFMMAWRKSGFVMILLLVLLMGFSFSSIAENHHPSPAEFYKPLIEFFDILEPCMSKKFLLRRARDYGVELREFNPFNTPPFGENWVFGESRHLVAILRGEDMLGEKINPQAILRIDLNREDYVVRAIYGFIYDPNHRPGNPVRILDKRIKDWSGSAVQCHRN